MRVLVCGGRDLDPDEVWNWLEANAHEECCDRLGRASHVPISVIIQGAARGADEGAASWARASGIKLLSFPADWTEHGKSAGPIRNSRMIENGKPDIVLAFPGGAGTADMVRKAMAAMIPVVEVQL